MKILIAGDFVVNQTYNEENIDENIIKLFKSADFNIVNLEAPVTNYDNKILKTDPHLKANQSSTKTILQKLNIDLVTLANNHIQGYDSEGVIDTLSFCKANNIATVGAGENLKTASQTFYLNRKNQNILIVNFAENEWCSAGVETPGANSMGVINNVYQILDKKKC